MAPPLDWPTRGKAGVQAYETKTGLELALLIRDITEKKDLFISLLIASIGFATTNMGIAFVAGMIVTSLIKWRRIQF